MGKQKLYLSGSPTKRMQLRGRNEGDGIGIFVCGIDIFEPAELSYPIVTSNIGIWGYGFKDFVENFIRYKKDYESRYDVYTVCDDPAFDSDFNDIPSPEIDEEHFESLFYNFREDENGNKFCELF